MDKIELVEQLAERLNATAQIALRASEDAAVEARDGATPQEKREDARVALEQGRLAKAQNQRAQRALAEIDALAAFRPLPLPGSAAIALGALVEVEDEEGNILKFRVQNLFRSDVQVSHKKLLMGLSVRYNSHVRNIDVAFVALDDLNGILDTGVRKWMEDHTTGDVIVDGRVGVELTDQFRAALIVNNIGNRSYSMRPLAIEAPRSFQVQLSVHL